MADNPKDVPTDPADKPGNSTPPSQLNGGELRGKLAEQMAEVEAHIRQACQPVSPAPPACNKLGARKDASFMAICTAPSINWTPVGSCKVPLPYQTVQDLSNSVSTASTVRFNGLPAYLLDKTTQPKGTGDERGTAKGIRSGTVTGEVKPVSGCSTVRIEGKLVVREGDRCAMNGGNNPGIFVAKTDVSAPASSIGAEAKLECQAAEQAKRDAFNLSKDDLSKSGLYRILGTPFSSPLEQRQYFQPLRRGETEGQHLRTANNIAIALLGPFGAPAVLTRQLGYGEEAVSAANSSSSALFSLLGVSTLAPRQPHAARDLPTQSTVHVVSPGLTSSGLKIISGGKTLNYQPSSGVLLRADPARTTTVLGSYAKDMRHVVKELGNVKSTDLGPRVGDFNVLNVPDELYINPPQFWNDYNRPWLDNVIRRNDKILMATNPRFDPEVAPDGRRYSVLTTTDSETGKIKLSGFGREYVTLRRSGYRYENGEMKK